MIKNRVNKLLNIKVVRTKTSILRTLRFRWWTYFLFDFSDKLITRDCPCILLNLASSPISMLQEKTICLNAGLNLCQTWLGSVSDLAWIYATLLMRGTYLSSRTKLVWHAAAVLTALCLIQMSWWAATSTELSTLWTTKPMLVPVSIQLSMYMFTFVTWHVSWTYIFYPRNVTCQLNMYYC